MKNRCKALYSSPAYIGNIHKYKIKKPHQGRPDKTIVQNPLETRVHSQVPLDAKKLWRTSQLTLQS